MLELINVKKIYKTNAGDVHALDGINLLFPETGMVFITGKSGSGKTTMLNIIGGLDGIDEGEIKIFGKKFSDFTASEYDSYRNTFIGFIFQEYNLLPDYNIEKNVGIANELQGNVVDKERVNELLNSVGIESYEGRTPNQFSGGQKQRVAIARALIKNPKIIMADEPTGALDSVTGIQVIEELKRLSKEKLVIVISHDLELANKYADRIVKLVDGKVVDDFTINEKDFVGNVFEQEERVTIKSGADLNDEETSILKKAIKTKKPIKFTESLKIKQKIKTDESKIPNETKDVQLIKSKMKFKSAATLGAKSLKVKPLRLMFTILLSAIAFTVFGVFDTIASYDRANVISNLLQTGEYNTFVVQPRYITEEGAEFALNFNDKVISDLQSTTGYKFKPVYSVEEFSRNIVSSPISNKTVAIANSKSQPVPVTPQGKGYYLAHMSGIIEFGQDERDARGNIPEYGYRLLYGKYPKLNQEKIEKGDLTSVYEVAISSYLAESIIHHSRNDKIFGAATSPEDLIDMEFRASGIGSVEMLRIVGIMDCGEIPEKFDMLKTSFVSQNKDPNKALIEELSTYLAAGAYNLLFVDKGAVALALGRFDKEVSYYGAPASYTVDCDSKRYQMNERFYSSESFNANKVVMFNKDRTTPLASDEAIVNIFDLKRILKFEYENYDEKTFPLMKELKSYVTAAENSTTKEQLQANINALMERWNAVRKQATNDETKIYHKNLKLYKRLGANDNVSLYNFKVVGVYFDTDVYDAQEYNPLLLNRDALVSVGIYPEQGIYTSAIAKAGNNARGSKEIAKMVTSDKNYGVTLRGNSVLTSLEKSEKQILQFAQLFLYAALVLALFSMFMLFNYISTSIASKRQSIGILRALGSNSGDVFKMFITESMIISLINAVLANVLTIVACFFVNLYIKEFMSLIVNFAIFGIRQVLVILGISVLAGLISSIMPIIKIAKEKPVDLIRRP